VSAIRKEEEEKYLNSKLIVEEDKFINKNKKVELLLGAPEDNGLPPQSLDAAFSNLYNEEEQGGDDRRRGVESDSQVKNMMEEFNPKKFAEKAEQRFKAYLPDDEAKQLIKGLKS
jgi:hypothetical protein